jgi:oligopeptidase B
VLVHEPAKWVARMRALDAAAGDGDGDSGGELLFRAELGEGPHTGPAGRFARVGYEAQILAWVLDRLGAGSAKDTAVAERGADVTTGAGSG